MQVPARHAAASRPVATQYVFAGHAAVVHVKPSLLVSIVDTSTHSDAPTATAP
jgi:hypothetical protein